MAFEYKILTEDEILTILPLVDKLNHHKIAIELLKERFLEMVTQNYECVGVYDNDILIGVCGLWFLTRHYGGRCVEFDHVYIEEAYRNRGLGTQLFNWIYQYVKEKGCETAELNAYVGNYKSHKFYHNQDFKILGYHFLKKL